MLNFLELKIYISDRRLLQKGKDQQLDWSYWKAFD